MRSTNVLSAAALTLLAALAFAPAPAAAGDQSWHGRGGGYWSLPAGAGFARSGPGVGFGPGGFGHQHGDRGFFVGGRPGQHGWSGGRGHAPVLVGPSFGQPVVVVRDRRGFVGRSGFGVRRFDRVARTIVVLRAGDDTSLVVEDWVPVPRFKPWRQSRAHLRFTWD